MALLAAFAVPAPAVAQSLADACATVREVRVGQWAAYEVTAPQMGGGPAEMRFAIVGTEAVDGNEHYWYEMKMASPEGEMILQFLVPEYPFDQRDIKDLVMKGGDQPAMRMPEQMIGMMMQRTGGAGGFARDAVKECEGADMVGQESVTVPAGTFDVLHLRTSEGDVWVSLEIPFGLVKMMGGGGEQMVLMEHGSDATSSITETPREMPGM